MASNVVIAQLASTLVAMWGTPDWKRPCLQIQSANLLFFLCKSSYALLHFVLLKFLDPSQRGGEGLACQTMRYVTRPQSSAVTSESHDTVTQSTYQCYTRMYVVTIKVVLCFNNGMIAHWQRKHSEQQLERPLCHEWNKRDHHDRTVLHNSIVSDDRIGHSGIWK